MVRKGYVEQMIEAIIDVAATLLGLNNKGDYAGALLAVWAAGKRLTGYDLDMLGRLQPKALLGLFAGGQRFDASGAVAAGMLMDEEAKIYVLQGEIGSAGDGARRALCLLIESQIHEPQTRTIEIDGRIELLKDRLSGEPLPLFLQWQEFRRYEAISRFDLAVNMLFVLRERGYPDSDKLAEAFYRRLSALPDHILAAGNLPRDEVADALAAYY